MQGLHIADAGFSYIFRCIGLYYEGNVYFLLYIASLVFLSFAGGGQDRRRMREIFLPQFILMAITVYNPVFPVALNSFFDVNKEYYRFLWMTPVIICMAAAGTVMVTDLAGNPGFGRSGGGAGAAAAVRQWAAAVFILCLFAAGGSYLYKDGYIVSPTIYHMPDEIPGIAEMIHEDSDEEYPRAMFEYDYNMMIRQYDASILLSCDRETYLDAMAGNVTYDTAMEDGAYIDRLLAVVGLNIRIDEDRFISALEHTHTEYVVVTTEDGMVPYLKRAGLTVVGETEDFELPDYSEVWCLTPQVYDFLL